MTKVLISAIAATFLVTACGTHQPALKGSEDATADTAQTAWALDGRLLPKNVEDPADIAMASRSGTDDMAEIEIEAVEIELEADCIEVCMD